MSTSTRTTAERLWLRPLLRATLGDYRALAIDLRQSGTPFADEAVRFLKSPADQMVGFEELLVSCELPNFHRALARKFPHWRLRLLSGPAYCSGNNLWMPQYRRVEVRPGRYGSFLSEGALFFEAEDGTRRIVDLDTTGGDEPTQRIRLVGRRSDQRRLRREFAELRGCVRRRSYLQNQAMRPDGTLLKLARPATWDDVALAPETRATLERNTTGFFALREVYRRNRVPQRRGVLLYGPPGTGKTMVGRVLASQRRTSFIWVTSADVSGEAEKLRWVFTLARRVRPAILFLEDLDMYAQCRGWGSDSVLGELLSQMDGLESNDGLVIVATTNDLEAIEPAVRERPSRFDVVLEIGLPRETARRQLLAGRWSQVDIEPRVLDQAARETDGLSGAQVCEVATQAMQEAILRGAVDAELRCQLSAGDVRVAVERLTGKKRAPLGFHAQE